MGGSESKYWALSTFKALSAGRIKNNEKRRNKTTEKYNVPWTKTNEIYQKHHSTVYIYGDTKIKYIAGACVQV